MKTKIAAMIIALFLVGCTKNADEARCYNMCVAMGTDRSNADVMNIGDSKFRCSCYWTMEKED